MATNSNGSIVALDVGTQRIGVAEANVIARIAHPFMTLQHTESIVQDIDALLVKQEAVALVVGLPRGLEGQETAQTRYVQDFVTALEKQVTVPIHWQDEAVTSQKAEAELNARKKPYSKGDIDALAAAYILEDYLRGL